MVDCLFRHRQPNVAKAVPTLDSPTLSSISCTSHQPDKHRHFIHSRSLHTRSNRGCMLVIRIRLSWTMSEVPLTHESATIVTSISMAWRKLIRRMMEACTTISNTTPNTLQTPQCFLRNSHTSVIVAISLSPIHWFAVLHNNYHLSRWTSYIAIREQQYAHWTSHKFLNRQ